MNSKNKNKIYTRITILILLCAFFIYLLTAKPSEKFGWNQNNEIKTIQKMDKLNQALNRKAVILPKKIKAIETSAKGVYSYVEKMPKFINCEYLQETEAFVCTKRYILNYVNKIILPEDKLPTEVYRVFVKFIVNENGYLTNVEINNGTDKELNKLVIEHIKKMPKFARAGYQNNEAVKVQYVIPVTLKPHQD